MEPGRTNAIAALRYRDFRLFWFGLLVANTGTWMQLFGQGYLVVQLAVRDGVPQLAPLYIGLVGLARAVPGLTFGLFAGVIVDRSDRRRLLLTTQTLAAISAAVFAGLTVSGRIDIVQVLLLGAINSLIFSFDAPTRQSMVPRLVPERDLMSAIGLNSAAFNGPQIFGPVVGGLILGALANALSPVNAVGVLFAINAISYAATVGALVFMAPVPVADGQRGTSVVRSIREGLGYVRREPVIRWSVLLVALSALTSRPYIQLLPAVAHETFSVGAVELSWMFAASGVGSFLGSIAVAALGNVRRRGLLLLGAVLAMGLLLAAFGTTRSILLSLPVLTLVGFTMMVFLGLANTLLQTRSPDHLRGRVMSVHTMLFMGVLPLGSMVLGTAGTFIGVSNAMAIGGLVIAGAAIFAALRAPALRLATSQPRHRRPHAQIHPRPGHAEVRNGSAAD